MTMLQRLGQLNREQEINQRAKDFAHVARWLTLAAANRTDAVELAERDRAPPQIVQAVKAAVDAGSTTGWGQPLAGYDTLAEGFLQSLRQASAFDAMLPSMRSVPMHTNVIVASGGATGQTTGEAQIVPIAQFQFQLSQIVEMKTTAIVAFTAELLRITNSNLFAQEMTRTVAAATDTAFLSRIINGISATTSVGGTSVAILQDLAAALFALTLDASSKVFLTVDSNIAKHWSVATTQSGELLFPQMSPTGGVVQGMPVLVSDGVTNQIIAIDASQIAAATGNGVELDASNQAALQLDTAPNSPPNASGVYVSMWQMNMASIRATRYWAAERLRAGAVAVVSSVSYGSANSPA